MIPSLFILLQMVLRSLGVARPLLGNFASYQTDQAMIARFFMENHWSTLLYPQVNVLVNQKPGLHLLYYPAASLIAAACSLMTGLPLDLCGRLQAILFFGAASFLLYRWLRHLENERLALTGLFVFSFCPLTLIYGQSFQNEMATVFFSVLWMFALCNYFEDPKPLDSLAVILSVTGILLTRPNLLYLILPSVYFAIRHAKGPTPLRRQLRDLAIMVSLGAVLPTLWYLHTWNVSHTQSHIYSTLFAQLMVRTSFLSKLIFQADFYKNLFDTLTGITLTPVGATFLILGVFSLPGQNLRWRGLYMIWALAFLLVFALTPRKLVDHNFYLLHLAVPLTPLIALGVLRSLSLFAGKPGRARSFIGFLVTVSFLISLRYSLYPAFKTPEHQRRLLDVAAKVRTLTSKDKSRVISQGPHAFLYYADRFGWGFEIGPQDRVSEYYTQMNWEKLPPAQWRERNEAHKHPITLLEYLRKYEGASHFVVTDPEEFRRYSDFSSFMLSRYEVLDGQPESYLIFDLSKLKG